MLRQLKPLLYFALTALAVSASAFIPPSQPVKSAEHKPMFFGFDAQGRVKAITNAIGKVTSFTYSDAGNLKDRLNSKNETTHYDYDALNRLTNVVHEGVWKAAFKYDANGNITTNSNSVARTSFAYDTMNRLTNSAFQVSGFTFPVSSSYDLNGSRTNIVYPGGLSVAYGYDAENRLTSVVAKNAQITKTFSFGHDGASRLESISYPNGVNSSFGYDVESRVTNYIHGTFLNHAITRDLRGFKMREDIYHGLVPTITNSLRQTRTHNDADQLTAATSSPTNHTNYTYDENGNLTNALAEAQSPQSYSFDYDNRLISVSGGSSSTSTVYLYDASGARVGRIANGATNYFVVDYAGALKRPLAETDASGNITRYYVWAGFQLLAHIEANGTVRYYHGDELGSTLALTDEAGTATDQFAYAPYGELLSRTGTNSTAFLWLGGYGVYYDAATDLHLTLHRAYSAEQKRFISPDPMGIDGGVNLYAYGDLNPLAFIDPYGLYSDNGFWSDMWDETRSLLAGIPSGIANLFLSVPDPTYGFRSPGSGQEAMNNVAKIMADLAGTTVDEPNFQKGQFIGSFLSGNWLFGRMFAASTPTAYRAVDPKYAQSTLDNGFYRSGSAGRLGNDGIYANSSVQGAVAEFQYHNPGVSPTVFEVKYSAGSTLKVNPPSGNFYVDSPLPFTQGANTLSAPSLRQPGTINYLIREGAVPGRIVQ